MASSVNDVPSQLSNGVHNFCISGYPIGDNCRPNLSDDMQSSWRMGIRNVHDSSFELLGSLEGPNLFEDNNKKDVVEDFQDYMRAICECMASDSASCSVSSESVSFKEDCLGESPGRVEQSDSDSSEAKNVMPVSHMAVRPGKKGTCYRCLKGNRFTEKEVCIVCGAKYCSNCVFTAMGSMPEGRKCFTCIGQRIDESKRKTLGKCSSMLKQLLSEFDVKQIMNSEKLCKINQLPPELVYVNGNSLSRREISILRTCPNPPKKLKPGRYWYDKVSGFWGKEGEKPCQIISPHMNVGGPLKRDASNGNTNIIINDREITKPELLMLQWIGVKCEVTTSFRLSADGRYKEEGMNAIKGSIWDKQRAKVICTILSLPTPPGSSNLSEEEVSTVSSYNLEQKTLRKLLLVGDQNSGTSTIFKQAKIVYKIPFTEEERRSVKFMIQINLYGYLRILLEGRKRFEEECLIKRITHDQCSSSENTGQINQKTMYSIEPRLEAFSDLLLEEMVSGNLKTNFHECAHFIVKLWKDPAIQTTYDRMSELQLLPSVAKHFLEQAVEITMTDYQPSEMDILYAEESASSKLLSRPSMEFSFPKFADERTEIHLIHYNPFLRYQLIRVPPSILKENCVLLEPCSDVDIVLFCVSLTDYAEFEYNCGIHTNKMIASKQCFETVVTHSKYKETKFLLVLNKYDLFEEKVKQVPLTQCEWFADFNPDYPVIYNEHTWSILSPSLACHAFHYIAMKFKRWFGNLTNKKLYVSPVAGLEPDSVDEVLRYAREIVEREYKYILDQKFYIRYGQKTKLVNH